MACLLALGCAPVLAQEPCPEAAVIESIEGAVELNRNGTTTWVRAGSGDMLCPGDSIQTGPFSRALLRLSDGTNQRLLPDSEARWNPPQDDGRSIWTLLRGLIHIISREPRSLEYSTPFANAGLEGTEFLIEVLDEAAAITVIEGVVSMRTEGGSVSISAGERGVAGSNAPATVGLAPDYLDRLGSMRDFTPVWDASAIEPDQEPSADLVDDANFYADRAAQRLRRGQQDDAANDLSRALALDSQNPRALALAAQIAAEFPDTDIGRLAAEARMPNPDRTLELLALAVTQQGEQDWAGARASLEAAVELAPDNSIAWARLAETFIALDGLQKAESAAVRAIELDPDSADAHTMFGFVQLQNLDVDAAIASFDRAVALDPSLALPHVGLGLARTQRGDRAAGLREIELAVPLDPADGLARSYAGKAYSDLRRISPAESQIDLAKLLDEDDPTPYVYGAYLEQSTNDPIGSLRSFDRAAARNDGRTAYRSSLVFDDDSAAGTAGIGQMFRTLGFEHLALAAGTASTQGATRDYAGHRLLGDIYGAVPRHQIARVSELTLGQMLQEVTATAIPPQLAEPNMFILDTAGPGPLAHSEFNSLLASNHLTVQGAATTGGNDTRGEQLTFSGINDRFSFSTGYYGFESAGFRANNDIDSEVGNALVQYRPNATLSLIGELRSAEVEKGDTKLLFHDDNFNPELRDRQSFDTLRLGMHRLFGENGDLLAMVQLQDSATALTVGPSASTRLDADDEAVDLQHLYRRDRWQLTTGIALFGRDLHELNAVSFVVPEPPFLIEQVIEDDVRTEFMSAYAYSDFRLTNTVTLTLGASVDELEDRAVVQSEFNPKLGLTWTPNAQTTVRAAAFSVLQNLTASKENILPRLEPIAVAGFNQFFFGSTGDEVWRYGVGVDRQLSSGLYYGVELSRRDVDTSILVLDSTLNIYPFPIDAAEDSARAYAYWTFNDSMAFGAELHADVFDNGGYVLQDGLCEARDLSVAVAIELLPPRRARCRPANDLRRPVRRFRRVDAGAGRRHREHAVFRRRPILGH